MKIMTILNFCPFLPLWHKFCCIYFALKKRKQSIKTHTYYDNYR